MARKQVIVQLDEVLLRALDDEAHARGINRSELIRRAASTYLSALREIADEQRMIEAYTRIPDTDDPELTEAILRLAAENWPAW